MNEVVFTISMVSGITAAVCISLIFVGIALGKIDV